MPIIKEWRCQKCSHEFARIRDECPLCHEAGATRVFLTPFGISNGVAKRTDSILEHQFNKMGITNFSNAQGPGGHNKITWKPKKFGSRSSGGQPEIVPSTSLQNLVAGMNPDGSPLTVGFDHGQMARTVDTSNGPQTVPYAVPRDVGAGIPWGVPIGGRPEALYKQTRIVGKLDSDGKSIQRTG